eukprot:3593867-Alexandrium_andersonii.AAC.1
MTGRRRRLTPSAFAVQGPPTACIAGGDAVWKDVEDRGAMVALACYGKVVAECAGAFEVASGPFATFVRI